MVECREDSVLVRRGNRRRSRISRFRRPGAKAPGLNPMPPAQHRARGMGTEPSLMAWHDQTTGRIAAALGRVRILTKCAAAPPSSPIDDTPHRRRASTGACEASGELDGGGRVGSIPTPPRASPAEIAEGPRPATSSRSSSAAALFRRPCRRGRRFDRASADYMDVAVLNALALQMWLEKMARTRVSPQS